MNERTETKDVSRCQRCKIDSDELKIVEYCGEEVEVCPECREELRAVNKQIFDHNNSYAEEKAALEPEEQVQEERIFGLEDLLDTINRQARANGTWTPPRMSPIESAQRILYNESTCDRCPNNPANGGSGICNCTIPYKEGGPVWSVRNLRY